MKMNYLTEFQRTVLTGEQTLGHLLEEDLLNWHHLPWA